MKFKLNKFHRNISDEELLKDLKRVNNLLSKNGEKITSRLYNEIGHYTSSTISARFLSWNKALAKAGISAIEEKNISEKDLFDNLKNVWLHKGAQPVFRDMKNKPSRFSAATYHERFGSWQKALKKFIAYVNSDIPTLENNKEVSCERITKKKIKRTPRNISERMRFRILLRDGFRCKSCGRSPIKNHNVELQVDHIRPWSKGGETIPKNLETKCIKCNLGKGNAFNK